MKKVLILGVNGFIGHHLTRRILETTQWEVYGMDMSSDRLGDLVNHPRMHFFEGDITINKEWIEYTSEVRRDPAAGGHRHAGHLRAQPLRVFELDFEANLPIVRGREVRQAPGVPVDLRGVRHVRRREFDPEASALIYGPINKPRWIYACSKQLMDRVIHAYGMEGLNYTLFRPFNWIGPGLDSIFESKEGSRAWSRSSWAISCAASHQLVDGGAQSARSPISTTASRR
jgi:nucleoside-diphosphate-sugar epimerase